MDRCMCLGNALLTVVLSTMVMGRFAGSSILTPALGALIAAFPLGMALALITLPAIVDALSWRVAMIAVALVCGLLLAGAVLVLRDPPNAPGNAMGGTQKLNGPLGLQPGELAPVVAAGVAWAGHSVAFAVLLGFLPALLSERGMPAVAAGLLASLAVWIRIPLLPFGGAFADYTGRPMLAACLMLITSAVAVISLVPETSGVAWAAVAITAAGLLSTPPGPVIMALPARVLSPDTRAIGMGIYYTLFYVGMAALPPLAGWARDATGFASAPLVAVAAFYGLAIIGIAVFSALEHRLASTPGDELPPGMRRS
jgi:predicted MFS family arabinose efflux permease